MESRDSRRITVSFAMLAGIVVVAGFMAIQFPPRSGAPATAAISPSPVGPLVGVDFGPPPTGVPLLWVNDPSHPGWLIGFDWTGKPRGTAKLTQQVGPFDRFSQAPDGSGFAYEPNAKGGFQVFFDAMGNPFASSGPPVGDQSEMWADDSRHLCILDSATLHWTLGLAVPGAAPNPVNEIALDPLSLARSGIIAFSFAACSARNDRAVIRYSYPGRPTAYSVVRISDGAVLQQRTYPAGQVENVVASMDGTLIAENSGVTLIRRASDLSLTNSLDPNLRVLAFSGDDSSVLVSTAPQGAAQPANQEVLDLQSGRVIWRGEGTAALSSFAVQPGGNAFALALTTDGNPPGTILMIYGDGSRPAKLPGLFTPIW
jgi:hypothetical protein